MNFVTLKIFKNGVDSSALLLLPKIDILKLNELNKECYLKIK